MAAAPSPVGWRPQHALARYVGAQRPISRDADIGATVDRFDRHRRLLLHAAANCPDRPVALWSRSSFNEKGMFRGNRLMDGPAPSAAGKTGSSSCRQGSCQDRQRVRHTLAALAFCLSEASAVTACSGSNKLTWSSLCLVSLRLHPSKGSEPTSAQRGPSSCRSFASITGLYGRLWRR